MPRLIDLLRRAGIACQDNHAPEITHITADSRDVRPGTLFVALKGGKADGAQFIAQAKRAGAVAVLCDTDTAIQENIMVLRVQNPRLALARLAAAFYNRQPAQLAAVTGTDGKTSTADFFRQFWHLLGKPSASIGTLGVRAGDGALLYPGSHTTPDPVQLHSQLAGLAAQGVERACLEASSHGLHQYRLDGVALEAAAFTNIARDHLDYHLTEDAYFAAKARLFGELLPGGKTAVLNADDARFAALAEICAARRHRVIGFGRNGEEFRIVKLMPHGEGQVAELELHGKPCTVNVPLAGAFQIMNILAALGLAEATGADLEQALAVIPQLQGVPGRLQLAARLNIGASVYVDYAHTPMALANILATLRPHTQNRLHAVFGCGGDRDAGKRPEMGRIACELADHVIVTDDNPRSEPPAAIRSAILAACPRAKEVADRKEAIYVAMRGLAPGDVLVIAGKGHETTQIIGDKTFPFDDAAVAREVAESMV